MVRKQTEKLAQSPRNISPATLISDRTKEDDREKVCSRGRSQGIENSELGIPPKQPQELLILLSGVQNHSSPVMATLLPSLPLLNGNIY